MDPLFILRTYLRIPFGSTSPVSFQSTWFKVSILFASEAVWSRYLSAFGLFVVGLVCFQISRVVWLQTVGLIFSFCSHLEGVLAAVSACLGFPGHFGFFPYGLCLLTLLRYQFLRLSMVLLQQKALMMSSSSSPQPNGVECQEAPHGVQPPTRQTLHSRVRKSLSGSSGKTHRVRSSSISGALIPANMQDPAETQCEKPVSEEKLIRSILETKTRSKTHIPRRHK